MEADELVGSADGSLGDPYDMAMAQMQAHMLADGDDLHSLDAASGNSDEELRIIMDPESRTGFVPVSAAPAAKVPRSTTSERRGTTRTGSQSTSAGQRVPAPATKARANKENRTRARARKPHEPDPFLSIDTLPTDKAQRQPTPSRERKAGSKNGERKAGSKNGSSVAARRKHVNDSSGRQTRAPPGTPAHPVFHASRSRMSRNASSAVSSEWNPLVPKQKPLSGAALENPVNKHVKVPFKHAVNKPDLDKAVRPMSPGQTMKERTMLATFHLARTMARQRGEEEDRPNGRLLKGRLKPLYPVRVEGPGMGHCRGVVAEENTFMNGDSRTVARRRKIMAGMLNKDFLYERPPTAESLHHTSVASDLSEGREKDLDDMVEQAKHTNQLTPPQDGMREPPNSLASASDPNFRNNLNPASASGLSSDVFEIDEIPKTTFSGHVSRQDTIEEVADPESSKGSFIRPNTPKAVRFVETNKPVTDETEAAAKNEEKDNTKNKEEESDSGAGCKPQEEMPTKRNPDDDPDGDQQRGQGQDRSGQKEVTGEGGKGQFQGGTQDDNQGKSKGQDKSGGNKDTSEPKEDNGDMKVENSDKPEANFAPPSYNSVLYTSTKVNFPRMGTVLPAKSVKATKVSRSKKAKSKTSSKPTEKVSGIALLAEGRESPSKDYYDKFARQTKSSLGRSSRPQSAKTEQGNAKPQLLRRPISASVPAKGKEPKVQFVIRPNADSDVIENDNVPPTSPRLNEVRCHVPLSARTHTSGVLSTDRDLTIETTVRRNKDPRPAAEFKVEGAKMSQAIKAGMCTVCGKSTTKIAEYWEETGALVCEVCDRRTRAEEQRKIDWIRKTMSNVYTGECNEQGDPVESHLMLTENGENGGLSNLDDLEKALNAIHCEINEAIKDVHEGVTHAFSDDEETDDEEEELLALANDDDGDNDDDDTHNKTSRASTQDTAETAIHDEEPEKITSGDISKILTQVEVDPATVSEYEMRVYWYKYYCQTKEKETTGEKSVKKAERRGSGCGQVYEDLRRVMGHQAENGEINTYRMTMVAEQRDDPVSQLLQQQAPEGLVPAEKVQHFKGQRIPVIAGDIDATLNEDGNLGVSGTAKKLLRNPSAKKPAQEAIAPFAPLCFRINARPPPGFLYYFAYGADMNPDRMKTYVQRAVDGERLWGLLYGFGLVFNKRGVDVEAGAFPNLQLQAGASVEGSLYLITLEELDKVDRQVGYPEHYDHAMLPVWLLNCDEPDEYGVAQYCVPALVYVAKDEWIYKGGATLSSDYAVEQCMKGGGDILTPAYQEHLAELKT